MTTVFICRCVVLGEDGIVLYKTQAEAQKWAKYFADFFGGKLTTDTTMRIRGVTIEFSEWPKEKNVITKSRRLGMTTSTCDELLHNYHGGA